MSTLRKFFIGAEAEILGEFHSVNTDSLQVVVSGVIFGFDCECTYSVIDFLIVFVEYSSFNSWRSFLKASRNDRRVGLLLSSFACSMFLVLKSSKYFFNVAGAGIPFFISVLYAVVHPSSRFFIRSFKPITSNTKEVTPTPGTSKK